MSQEARLSLEDIIKTAEHKMTRAVEILGQDLQTVRTGRASPALLDRIQVDYYGAPTPINGVANISTPDPRMVVVQPWDRGMLGPIEKAIQKSDLGINPTNDGQVIRLTFSVPALWPASRGKPRRLAQRPLPSMMMPTWVGTDDGAAAGAVALVASDAGTPARRVTEPPRPPSLRTLCASRPRRRA